MNDTPLPTDEEPPVAVRHFVSASEVRALPGYKDDNPVTPENYGKIFGHYELPEEEFRCCYVQKGALCHEPHKWGFVAHLKDNSVTVIGNLCARTKFAKDAEGFKRDLARYENQRERDEAWKRIQEVLIDSDARIARLQAMRGSILDLAARMKRVTRRYGPRIQTELSHMARTDRPTVTVLGVRRRQYVEDGKTKFEETATPVPVGRIAGIKLTQPAALELFADKFKEIMTAIARALAATPLTRTSELRQLVATISSGEGLISEGQSLLDLEPGFNANDFSLFCFLTDDRHERLRAARAALRLDEGQEFQHPEREKDRVASEWLAEREAQIIQDAGVDALRIY